MDRLLGRQVAGMMHISALVIAVTLAERGGIVDRGEIQKKISPSISPSDDLLAEPGSS